MQQSYKIELKKIAIHPDHKKIEFSRKGIYRIKIAAKNNVGTGSKQQKMKKKILLTKTDLLSKCNPKCITNITAGQTLANVTV